MNLSNPKAQGIFIRIKKLIKATFVLIDKLPNKSSSFQIISQLSDAITSVGANFIEAQSARSKKEFISIMSIVLREAKETIYWFELMKELNFCSSNEVDFLIREMDELVKIFASIVITSSKSIRN